MVLLICVLLSFSVVQAGGPQGTEAERVAALVAQLDLSEEQLPEVEATLGEMVRRQRRAVSRLGAEREQMDPQALQTLQEELRDAQRAAREELADVLTEQQLAEFDTAVEQQRSRAAGEAIVARLQEPLKLTVEQHEELVPIFAANVQTRSQMREKMQSAGRSFGAARNSRESMLRMQQELESEIEPILTPEQMELYRELAEKAREEFRGRQRGTRSR
jgi:Sec-independent protein translocase protein TatA